MRDIGEMWARYRRDTDEKRRDIGEIQARYWRDLRGERHLEEELLLREAAELQLLLGVGRELRVVAQLLEHLLVQRLREEALRRLLLHHLAGEMQGDVGEIWARSGRDIGEEALRRLLLHHLDLSVERQ